MDARTERETMERYQRASRLLESLIQGPPSPPPDATPADIRARALARIERLRSFLSFLGDPHLSYRTAHVAGTSGKGSTSAFLASILSTAGLKTGLHVSPYLQVETEKLQIDDRLMSAHAFADHVEALDSDVRRWVEAGGDRLTYGEFWVALTFFSFHREDCQFAVIEAGAGGRFDLTNLVRPDVSVITSVGLDHVRTLGETIPEIAWHKAGIIKPGVPAVTTVETPAALDVIRAEAFEKDAELIELRAGRDYDWDERDGECFLHMDVLTRPVRLPLAGAFQAGNAAVAVEAARVTQRRNGLFEGGDSIEQGVERTRFPGRVEVVQSSPQVILDGAHNPEKIQALVDALERMRPKGRRILVLGSLGGHDFQRVASIIAPVAGEILVTAPSAYERASAPVDEIVDAIRSAGVPYRVEMEPSSAVERALAAAGPDDQIIVTGSLYLVGSVRERWYPSQAIILQQTSFPEGAKA